MGQEKTSIIYKPSVEPAWSCFFVTAYYLFWGKTMEFWVRLRKSESWLCLTKYVNFKALLSLYFLINGKKKLIIPHSLWLELILIIRKCEHNAKHYKKKRILVPIPLVHEVWSSCMMTKLPLVPPFTTMTVN